VVTAIGMAEELAEKGRKASKTDAANMAGAKAPRSFKEAYRHE
jgi:hypothetical protein